MCCLRQADEWPIRPSPGNCLPSGLLQMQSESLLSRILKWIDSLTTLFANCCRIAAKLWPANFFRQRMTWWMQKGLRQDECLRSARQITFGGSICFVQSAAVLCEAATLLRLGESSTWSTSHAQSARRCLGHRIATTSTMERSFATFTIRLASLFLALAAGQPSSSNSSRSIATMLMNIGILSVT